MSKNQTYKNSTQQSDWRLALIKLSQKENDKQIAMLQNAKPQFKSPEQSSKLTLSKQSTQSKLLSIADRRNTFDQYNDNKKFRQTDYNKTNAQTQNKYNQLDQLFTKTNTNHKFSNIFKNNDNNSDKENIIKQTNQFVEKRINNYLFKGQDSKNDLFGDFPFDDEIKMKNLDLQQNIGKGSYATVYKAYLKSKQLQVAVKIYEISKLTQSYKIQNLKREIKILKFVNHPNIIKLHYAIRENRSICLIMENFSTLNLKQYLQKQPTKTLPEKDGKLILIQILQAINYAHQNDIIHRDIKPDNVLLDKDLKIKLIDFGFSIVSRDNKKLNMFCGTPSFMSPQIVNKQNYNGQKSDIWAIGVLYFYILYGRYPFRGSTDTELYKNIGKGNMNVPENFNKPLKDFFKQIFIIDESKRMSADQLLRTSYLSAI